MRCGARASARTPAIVGRTVRINGGAFTVVGVAPEGFAGSQRIFGGVGAWVPLETLPGERAGFLAERGARGLFLLGRLQPGVSLDAAQARYAVVANQLFASYPRNGATSRIAAARSRSCPKASRACRQGIAAPSSASSDCC